MEKEAKGKVNTVQIQYYQSPCGKLILGSFENKLCMCDWVVSEARRATIDKRIQKALNSQYAIENSEVLTQTISQLDEYFSRQRTTFDIPLLLVGTEFQKSVWNELLNIPYGTTISYAQLSQRLDNPKAIRAVASSNGANSISILIPCHRVIGSDHKLTGYAGGLVAKKTLVELESNERRLL